jgi:class 3 adenylate cyclase/tetratricopeptide (TPR) repeat protein
MPLCPNCGAPNADGFEYCGACGSPLATGAEAGRKVRKTVTVVFADVVGSTELGGRLDPESLQNVMSRYFAAMRSALERHGGTVEKFIGDAVMAVFGIPVAREDDALRAVRAGVEMRAALVALNRELEVAQGFTVDVRIGINTGEVLAGDAAGGQAFASGDAVNVAARLEQAAGSGEILIGDPTHELVREAVRAERVEGLRLKGKAEPHAAWRLVDVVADAPAFTRDLAAPLVARERELELLRDAFERATQERTARLVTVLGAAGIGKSRLVREFVATIQDSGRVVVGRCVPYGEGITYLPLAEIVKRLADGDARRAIGAALAGDEHGDLIADRVLAATGLGGAGGPTEETHWAVRRLLERLARDRPLAVVIDDIHWAEPTFLDLVEYLTAFASDAPIVLVCLARPDLLDSRPSWGAPRGNGLTLVVEPLTDVDSASLIASLLRGQRVEPDVASRIAAAAEGNPLFVEQMLAMVVEDDGRDSEIRVPPTIHALLTARIDALEPEERLVVERAAIEGRVFHRGAVTELLPREHRTTVGPQLMKLVRKELVRPDRSMFAADDGYRFAHMLIRDAAYDSLPRLTRAELHERFADWLEAKPGEQRSEHEDVLAYHLEQAVRYRDELSRRDDHGDALAERAASRLAAAARRLAARGDASGASNLFARASSLLPADHPSRLELVPEFAHSLMHVGEFARMEAVLAEADRAATGGEHPGLAAYVSLLRLLRRIVTAEVAADEIEWTANPTLHLFEELGDELGQARACLTLSWAFARRSRHAAREELLERARDHAERAGGREEELLAVALIFAGLPAGPVPVEAATERCDRILESADRSPRVETVALRALAHFAVMRGRFDEGRTLLARSHAVVNEFAIRQGPATMAIEAAELELLAGAAAVAEEHVRPAYEAVEAAGAVAWMRRSAAVLGEALYEQGRYAEAERYVDVVREAALSDDVEAQASWRLLSAKLLAQRGRHGEAEALAAEALELVQPTDALTLRATAFGDLATVRRLAGRRSDADVALREALRLYETKGNTVAAARIAATLEALASP